MREVDGQRLLKLFSGSGSGSSTQTLITEADARPDLTPAEIASRIGHNTAVQMGTVAKARPGNVGIPSGYDPHYVDNMVLVIDPHRPNSQEVTVAELKALSRGLKSHKPGTVEITQPGMAKAAKVQSVMSVPSSLSPALTVGSDTHTATVHVPSTAAVVTQAPPAAVTVSQQVSRSPLERLRRESSPAAPVPAAVSQEVSAGAVAAPSHPVVFEIDGVGAFDAVYHDVLVSDTYIILVYDARWKGGKFVPQTTRVMALQLVETDQVCAVLTTGVQFAHGGYEYCLLLRTEL